MNVALARVRANATFATGFVVQPTDHFVILPHRCTEPIWIAEIHKLSDGSHWVELSGHIR